MSSATARTAKKMRRHALMMYDSVAKRLRRRDLVVSVVFSAVPVYVAEITCRSLTFEPLEADRPFTGLH